MSTTNTKQKRSTEELLKAARARTDALEAKVNRRRLLESDGSVGRYARKLHRAKLACDALVDDEGSSANIRRASDVFLAVLTVELRMLASDTDKTAPMFPDSPTGS